jgi:hypothetical protein
MPACAGMTGHRELGPQKLFHNVNQQQARLSHAYH